MELLKHTTTHGLNHIYTATSKMSKLVWFFLFLLGLCGFLFNLVVIIKRYLSNPVIINHITDNERFIWPDLTFCNPTAPFPLHRRPSAYQHWKETMKNSKEIIKRLATKTKLFRIIQDFNTTDYEFEETTVTLSTADPQKLLSDDFRSNIIFYGYTTKPVGIYLVKEYSNSGTEVDKNELKRVFSTQYVQIRNNIPCHTFQIDKSELLRNKDVNSVIFVIRFNYPSYHIFNSSYIFRSIFLYVNNVNSLPQKDEILFLPGFNNELNIKQSRYIRNTNKKVCRNEIFKVDLYDALLLSTNTFEGDFEDCRKIASQKLYVKICKCYSPFLPIYKSNNDFPKLCLNGSLFSHYEIQKNAECMVKVFSDYREKSSFDKVEEEECGKYRTMKCDDVVYKTEQKREMWIELWSNTFNDRRRQFIQDNYTPLFNREWMNRDFVKEIRDDVAMLVIKRSSDFGDLYKEEFQNSIPELISSIGGLMSLWLGLSIIGLFEIMEFLYLILMELSYHPKETISKNVETDMGKCPHPFHPVHVEMPNYNVKLNNESTCCEVHYCSNPYNETFYSENGYLFSLNTHRDSHKDIRSMISSF